MKCVYTKLKFVQDFHSNLVLQGNSAYWSGHRHSVRETLFVHSSTSPIVSEVYMMNIDSLALLTNISVVQHPVQERPRQTSGDEVEDEVDDQERGGHAPANSERHRCKEPQKIGPEVPREC